MKRQRRLRLVMGTAAALGLGMLGLSGTASANDDHVDPHYYSDYDLNDDGVIDHFERDLMHYDRDQDGHLDAHERRNMENHLSDMLDERSVDPYYGRTNVQPYYQGLQSRTYDRYGNWYSQYDLNRDGQVDRWERRRATRGSWWRAKRFDRDGDGYVENWERRRERIHRGTARPRDYGYQYQFQYDWSF